ncbi:MAG: acyl-CoA reductase [Novosphingobium sp.]|nr:acyl-CoA reductase [Novosphingobium sp.]
MGKIVAPAVIRGQVITDNLVSFGGRNGELEFLSPDPDSIVERLPLRDPGQMQQLYTLTIDEIIDFLVELGQRLDLSKNGFMQEALELSYDATELTPSILRWQYSLIQHFFSRDMVRGYIDVPIGIPFVEGWQQVTLADGRKASVRAMGARCLHITAGNSPITAIITLARNALTRSDAIIKSPSNDPFTAVAVARTMIEMAPDHPLTKHFSVAYWKGGSVGFEEQLYQPRNIEKIIAWGGFAAMKHVTRYIQPGLELISLDPKRSATIIGGETFADEATMSDAALRAATDIGASNQTGCSSARVILVESGTDEDGIAMLSRFGAMIYEAMIGLPDAVSNKPKQFDAELRADIQGLRATPDFYDVIGGKDEEGAIIISKLDDVVDFYPRLSGRVANLVPIDDISEAGRFVNAYTQTVGVYPESLKLKLRDQLPLFGVQRFVTLGYAMTSNPALPQDAIEPVRRMVKWIVDEDCPVETCPPLWAE